MADTSLIIAQELNIQAYKGDTFLLPLVITDANGPVSFAGATFKMQIRKKASSAALLELLSPSAGITISGAGNNEITITKTPLDLDKGNYKYDLQATLASGIKETYLFGVLTVQEEITT